MNLTIDEKYHNRNLHNFADNLLQPRHRWYPFKEGFSSELVVEAIKSVTSGNATVLNILDPFSGSGTTPVTAALAGHRSVAIEVNPFCAFTSKVKCNTTLWASSVFHQEMESLLISARKNSVMSPLENVSTFNKPDCTSSTPWLFNTKVLRAFESIWAGIEGVRTRNKGALQLCAIRTAMMCCNAKKDGKALRYMSNWRDRNFTDVDFFDIFEVVANQMRDDTELAPISKSSLAQIINKDARRALANLSSNSFDLLVTSPPYLNSFDYSDIYRPELFLGKFINNNEELKSLRLKTIRSHVQVKWGGYTPVPSMSITAPVELLRQNNSLWNKRLPDMIEAYFCDMKLILASSLRLLKFKAEAWIVVSTSAYAGIHIPVDLILADIATQVGFSLKGVYVLRSLRAAGQQQKSFDLPGLPLRESLIILTKGY